MPLDYREHREQLLFSGVTIAVSQSEYRKKNPQCLLSTRRRGCGGVCSCNERRNTDPFRFPNLHVLTLLAQLPVREAKLAQSGARVPSAVGRVDLVPSGSDGPLRAVVAEPGTEQRRQQVPEAVEEVELGPGTDGQAAEDEDEGGEGFHRGVRGLVIRARVQDELLPFCAGTFGSHSNV